VLPRLAVGVVACLLIALSGCSSGEASSSNGAPAGPGPVKLRSAVVYGQGRVGVPQAGDLDLLLDLYLPTGGGEQRPAVVLVHGGGFIQQSRSDVGIVQMARALAARGIVAASIDYRLLDTRPEPSPRVAALIDAVPAVPTAPAQVAAIEDTLTAIDYLREHAKRWRVDPDRIGLIGSSAGAFTVDAVAYALDDHDIAAPEVAFVGSLWGGLILAAPGGSEAQPVDQVEAGEAALFAVHGDADSTVPVAQSDVLVAAADAAGIPNEYHRIPRGGHGYLPSGFVDRLVAGNQTAFDRLLAFAEARLEA
jgi:acetyl esterase/lipase